MASLKDVAVDQAEKDILYAGNSPRGRWRILSKVSPSGKTLFVCLSCGRESYSPDDKCPKPVTMWNREERECKDWKPSEFEVQ